MNATVLATRPAIQFESPVKLVLRWIMSAQVQAEQEFQLAEMSQERLRDMGLSNTPITREAHRPMIWA